MNERANPYNCPMFIIQKSNDHEDGDVGGRSEHYKLFVIPAGVK